MLKRDFTPDLLLVLSKITITITIILGLKRELQKDGGGERKRGAVEHT